MKIYCLQVTETIDVFYANEFIYWQSVVEGDHGSGNWAGWRSIKRLDLAKMFRTIFETNEVLIRLLRDQKVKTKIMSLRLEDDGVR